MKVTIKDLTYSPGGNPVLSIPFLTLGERGITGILGPNGSGKTTLLKHIHREIPSKNRVFLEDRDVFSYSPREFSKKVSILTQFQEGVDPSLTVEDTVLMGRYPHKGLFRDYDRKDEEIVEGLLSRFHLSSLAPRPLGTLSGGELQRVMMAKIFATNPELILLDEPTNHLDIRYKIEGMEMVKNSGIPAIITLHDLDLCLEYCDRVVVLKEGEVVEDGAPKEILTEDLLWEVYEVHYRILKEPKFIIYF